MRLKMIKLAGFKSFVDPTTVPTPSNLVCIVGPNGCGKSNTIDAVRWVMGESSAKNLRGDSMSDVIFNGSATRKPVGQASVELVFDNSDGRLGGEYAQYAEISIKRKVTRDGQSHYYLNGARCRRRDITDIFLGTGLGPRSYAIIEQGTISRMIEAKPEELRVFIEEAAGIYKYKERRRETENRMRSTRENLERIDDLRDELDKRLATLQRQARTAERYKELKQEERLLKAQLLALRHRTLDRQVRERDQAIEHQQTRLEAELAELASIESATESQREGQIEANEKFNEIQGRYYAVGAEIARLEQSIQHAREQHQRQRRELDEAERALEEASRHLESDREAITALEEEIATLEAAAEEARIAEEESAAVLAQAEENMTLWQGEWDEFNRLASEQLRAAEVERARIHHLEQNLERQAKRLRQLEEELAGLDAGGLDEEIEQAQQQRRELEERITHLREEMEQQRQQIADERELAQALASELDAERSRLQAMQGRKASLEALQQQALGGGRGRLDQGLHTHGLDDLPRLARTLEVEPGWERAVETALGLHLEALCVDGIEPLGAALAELDQGALALVDRSVEPRAEPSSGRGEPLLAKVRASAHPLDALLAGIYAADDLAAALALRGELQAHESIVTRDGLWIGPDWLRLSRGGDEKAGVLEREKELKQLAGEIELTREKIETLERQMEEGRARLRELELARDELQATTNQTTQALARAESAVGTLRERMQHYHTRKSRLERELEEAVRQRGRDEEQLAEARARLDEALALVEDYEQRRQSLTARRDELRAQLELARQRARADREAAHRHALQLQAARTQLDGTRKRMERTESQLEQLGRRREQLLEAMAGGDDPVAEMEQQLEELLQNRLVEEEALNEARRRVEEIDHQLRQLTEKRHQVERRIEEIRAELEKLRMGGQEFKVRRQTVAEQFAETGMEMEALLAELPEGAEEAEWQRKVEEMDRKIQRLGAINLAAIDEFKEQSERKHYLDAQHQDLTQALETLENAIRKIDKETRTRFKDTFDKVNAGVKELFPRLFGGGHAYLELTGDDLLDTGVTIMARPPGKRNSSIHLLSGGEKALTAVALVFSIFQLNPAPFCMLDEVDAPLDEANVGRFCDMVKQMSEKVQFIFITHNKVTMEMGEHLTGVTMNEPGVSRLVAVDMEEAMRMVG